MKHHHKIMAPLLALLFCFAGSVALAEDETEILKRTTVEGFKLQSFLSKDIYKSVPYREEYEEQEAYQAEEDYTVDIPYQEQETYYEDVPYTDTETYYEDVPYQERESYQDTETYYDSEYVCHDKTDYERVSRNEKFCAPPPGGRDCQMVEECGNNARGERICKTRKVCENGPRENVCVDREVCQNEPRSRQECGYEQVQKTRPVTKYRTVTRYRQELRTRTVTKYRSEARTRMVTKYRQETRQRTVTRYRTVTKCCVTRYRDEFDHTWQVNLQIIFPEQAVLLPNEIEKFQASLRGNENSPRLDFKVLDSIFGYQIAKENIDSKSATVELALVPKYNEKNLGVPVIGRIELSGKDDELNELLIEDRGIKPRVNTQYRYRILDKDTSQIKLEGEASSEKARNESLEIRLTEALPGDKDYVIQISATRSGIVLEKTFSFSLTKEILFQRWKAETFGPSTLKNAVFNETKDKSVVTFLDEGTHPKLETKYKLTVLTMQNEEVWSSIFNSKEVLDAAKNAKILIPQDALSKQDDLKILLQVQRNGRRLEKPVQFSIFLQRNYVSLAEAKDSKKLHSLSIEGRGQSARLMFVDDLKKSSRIKTEYKVNILRPGGFMWRKKKLIKELVLNKSQISNGKFNATLASMGVNSNDLEDYFKAGKKVFIELTAIRKLTETRESVSSIYKEQTVEIR